MFSSLSFWGDEREGRGCNVRCGAFNSSVFEFPGSGTFLTPCTTREGEATSVPHLSHWLVQRGSDTATLVLVKLNEKLRKNQVSYLMSEPWCFPWGCILTWKPSGSYKHLRANPSLYGSDEAECRKLLGFEQKCCTCSVSWSCAFEFGKTEDVALLSW